MYNIEEIKKQFKEVIAYSQNIDNPEVDTLFERWLEAKRDIIEAFNGELIIELPTKVEFHLDDKERTSHFDNFVHDISRIYHNNDLVDFLNANKHGFYDNVVAAPYEYKDIKVPQGMKIVKAFKYFEKDKRLLENFQIKASQIIQEDKIEGTLCFSVHPLDFLSTSVNTYNWRSCHALDGEFRSGNLSYMVDRSTIVCYLKGANNVSLPMFPPEVPWNSKKWRVLLYLSDKWDMIYASRQYPFSSKGGLDIVLTNLLNILKLPVDRYTDWRNDYIEHVQLSNGERMGLNYRYVPIRRNLYKIDDVITDGKDALQFNDLLRSSCYHNPYYSMRDDYWWYDDIPTPHFVIGGAVNCLHCGEEKVLDPDMMVCRHCAETYNYFTDEDSCVCDCCGARIFDGEWTEVQGEIVCENCFENNCFVCDACGEAHFNEYLKYDRKYEECICVYCYQARYGKEEI